MKLIFLVYFCFRLPVLVQRPLATSKALNMELCFTLKNVSHPRIEVDMCIHIIPLTSSRGFSSDEFPPKGLLATNSFSLGHIYF